MKYKKLMAIIIISLASINLFGCGDRMVEGINEAMEAEGGMEGVKNNAEELAGHFTDSLGITDAERYVIDEETGAIITDGNQTKDTTTNVNNFIGLNETVAFNMQNGGMINVTFTECGSKNDIAYITYVIENIGNIDVTVGESMFSVYANDYIADLNYGEHSVYEETISSGRKVSGKLYPNIIMDKVVKLEIECGDIVFLLRDTGKADAMLGTYYRIFEEDGNVVVNEVKLYRDVYNDDGLAITAKQHIDYGNGYDYDYDFGSWTFDLYEDKIVFTNSLHSIGGLVVYFNSNPVVEGIYVEQLDTQSVEDMFTGQYLWTDDIQSVYDSIASGSYSIDNGTNANSVVGEWTRSDSQGYTEINIYEWETADGYIPIIYAYYYDHKETFSYEGTAEVITDDKVEFVDESGNRIIARRLGNMLSLEQVGNFMPNGINFSAEDYELMPELENQD